MDRCENCKHFSGEVDKEGFGECNRGQARNGEPIDTSTLAFGYDYESYISGLSVKPTFGCVQFEVK